MDWHVPQVVSHQAHGEFNKKDITNEENISLKIEKGQDVFQRDYNLKKIEIDSSFPRYILENRDKLKKWII